MTHYSFQEAFDIFIRDMRAETDREIATGSLEYTAYFRAYIQGRIDALREIQQEQQSIIFNDLKERVG